MHPWIFIIYVLWKLANIKYEKEEDTSGEMFRKKFV